MQNECLGLLASVERYIIIYSFVLSSCSHEVIVSIHFIVGIVNFSLKPFPSNPVDHYMAKLKLV